MIFLIITAYPDKESHKKQHEVMYLFLYYFLGVSKYSYEIAARYANIK